MNTVFTLFNTSLSPHSNSSHSPPLSLKFMTSFLIIIVTYIHHTHTYTQVYVKHLSQFSVASMYIYLGVIAWD